MTEHPESSEFSQSTGAPGASGSGELYKPFVPRRGRAVAGGMAITAVVLFSVFALTVAGPGDGGRFGVGDRIMMVVLGLVIGGFLWRYVAIKAVPDEQGLAIRNLILSRRVEWTEVEAVRFHGGAAWPVLALTDGDEVAVMAVQKADGGSARDEATRLANLVKRGGGGRVDPDVTPEHL
ncbi:MAG: PH domain-containing protein [Actinomycetia bacterium]|nr:PH domain-containing protein [Actinomycetes bacterium]